MMKRVLALFLAASAPLSAQENPERVFTLAQSIQTALQNNQTLLSAREGVRIAQQRLAESRTLFMPSIGVHMSASRYQADGDAVLASEFGSTLLPRSPNDDADNYYAGRVGLRQVLYNGGRSLTNIRLAQAAVNQAKIKEEEIRGRVTVDTTAAFYDELLARRQLSLAENASRDLQGLAAALPAGDGAGRALLEGVQTRLRREQAERRRDEGRASLAFLGALGLELYTDAALQGELESEPLDLDLAKLLARAQDARLEIRGTEYQGEIDRLAVTLYEAERYPAVTFGAGYELANRRFPLDKAYWNTTLNVSLPLFDGFASRARIRRSRLAVNQTRIERAALEDQINREVREAYGDLRYWQDEMVSRRADAKRLETLYSRLATGRQPAEKAQVRLEVLSAQQAQAAAIHGHRIARAKLEKAVGMPVTNP